LIDEIWQWIKSTDAKDKDNIPNYTDVNDTARIFFLTSVAGAGKSTIAHTVAQRCHEERLLVSSFFFDRNFTDRLKRLFSTVARGLAGHNVGLREQIGLAIELDESLPMAPISRQFQDLILAPCRNHRVDGPLVVVIDALDEGYDGELLDILCDEVPKLPATFRILLTSREGRDFNTVLSRKPHVYSQSIAIDEQDNLEDIAIFVRFKLAKVAEWKDLGKHWPDQELLTAFTEKAEGLFLWVSTVCEYLGGSLDPDGELRSLISDRSPSDLPAEEKMDELYLTILQACNWKDKAFSMGYSLLMGAVMAAKTPLSVSALQSLHRASLTLPVNKLLQPVSSLLIGLAQNNQPIRPLHLSFRDFITVRAQSSPDGKRFYINEKEHSQRLALLCLDVMNQAMERDTPGLGYLTAPLSESNGIPVIAEGIISEEMWYACEFWMDHMLEVDDPGKNLIDVLQCFFSNHLVTWIEIITSKGQFRNLLQVKEWIQVCMSITGFSET